MYICISVYLSIFYVVGYVTVSVSSDDVISLILPASGYLCETDSDDGHFVRISYLLSSRRVLSALLNLTSVITASLNLIYMCIYVYIYIYMCVYICIYI